MTAPYPQQPPYYPPPQPPKRIRGWHIAVVVIGIVLVLGVIGNLSDDRKGDDKPSSASDYTPPKRRPVVDTAPPRTTVALSPAQLNDLSYVGVIDSENIRYSSTAAIIDLGHAVCEALNAGASPLMSGLQIVESSPYDIHEAGYIVGASVAAYCPQHRAAVDAMGN